MRLRTALAEGDYGVERDVLRAELTRLFQDLVRELLLRDAFAHTRKQVIVDVVGDRRGAAHERELFRALHMIILHNPRFSLRG